MIDKHGGYSFKKKYLIMLSVALLPVCSLAELFILSLALNKKKLLIRFARKSQESTKVDSYLGVVFSLTGGAVFSLALVLVLFHAHLEKSIRNDQVL